MFKNRSGFLVFIWFVLLSSVGVAQTLDSVPATGSGQGASGQAEDTILLMVQPVEPVAVEGDAPVGIDFRITDQLDGDNEPISVSGLNNVKLKGLTRVVIEPETGEQVVQVVITNIEQDGDLELLSGFESSWVAEDDSDLVFSLSDEFQIIGDRDTLVSALALLSEEAAEEELEKIEVSNDDQKQPVAASSGSDSGESSVSDAATGYTKPESVETTPDPVVTIKETKDGCLPRVDFALTIAVDQIKDQTFHDGIATGEETDCYDSYHPTDKYRLEKDYTACAVNVPQNVSNGATVTDRYKWYYTNANGRVDVSSGESACIDDPTRTYTITEDYDSCVVNVDYSRSKATPQARLVYEVGGVSHQVRNCDAGVDKPEVDLELETSLCPQPESGVELGVFVYRLDGRTEQVGVCDRTDAIYESRVDYDDCGVVTDREAGFAYYQVRDLTLRNGEIVQPKDECRNSYDLSDRKVLVRDYDSCSSVVSESEGTTTSRYQLSYTNNENREVRVHGCEVDTDLTLVFFEDFDACEPVYRGDQVIWESQLVYQTRDGAKNVHRDCRPSEERGPITMEFNPDLCINPDGLTPARLFNEKGRYQYVLNGVTQTVGECVNTGRRIEYRAVEEGCRARNDFASDTIYQEYKIQKWIDGSLNSDSISDCQRSVGYESNIALQRDYRSDVCEPDLNRDRTLATAKYQLYHGTGSNRETVGGCLDDVAITYAVTSTSEGCSFDYNERDREAIPQLRTVYESQDGVVHEVERCAPDEQNGPIVMIFNTEACGNPDSTVPHPRFEEQGVFQYTVDGVVETYGECQDTGRRIEYIASNGDCGTNEDLVSEIIYQEFKIETWINGKEDVSLRSDCQQSEDYADNINLQRNYSSTDCPADFNRGDDFATAEYQLFYETGSDRTTVGGCQSDAAITYAVRSDLEACSFDIDERNREVFVQSRKVYETQDGVVHEVQDCARDEDEDVIPMVFNVENCGNPDGSVAIDEFNEQGRLQYTFEGVVHTVEGGCKNTGREIEYRANNANCGIRQDISSETIYQEFRIETWIDGNLDSSLISACQSSDDYVANIALQRDYSSTVCPADLNDDESFATARYQLYHEDGGQRKDIGRCLDDASITYAVKSDSEGCSFQHDENNRQVLIQSRTIYETQDGIVHEVDSCEPDVQQGPIPMVYNTDVCNNPDGTAPHGRFNEQGRFEYTVDGVLQTYGECENTGRRIEYRASNDDCGMREELASDIIYQEFKIETWIDNSLDGSSITKCQSSEDYADNINLERDYSSLVCDADLNRDKTEATANYQLYYTIDGRRENVGNCLDDATITYAVTTDFESCDLIHDEREGLAKWQSRQVYESQDGVTHEVKGCATSEARPAIEMVYNTDVCENPSEIVPGDRFNEQGVYEYDLNGVVQTVGECGNTGRRFEYRVDFDTGCGLRTVEADETVYRQFVLRTLVNGDEVSVSSCQYSDDVPGNAPLVRNYDACQDNADYRNFQITKVFQYTYDDPIDRVSKTYGECQEDAQKVYALVEDHESCDISVNVNTRRAVPQSRLIYSLPDDGAIVEARACQDSETRSEVAMTLDPERCPIVELGGSDDGVFAEKGKWTYQYQGQTYETGGCVDTGIDYERRTITDGCDIREDKGLMRAFLQVKTQILKDDSVVSTSACQDSAHSSDVYPYEKSRSACTPPYFRVVGNLAARYFKWIYTDGEGEQHFPRGFENVPNIEEATGCIRDPDAIYRVRESFDACRHEIDYENMRVYQHSQRVYETPLSSGSLGNCRRSSDPDYAPVPLEPNYDACPIQHNIRDGVSNRFQTYTYRIDNRVYQIGTCGMSDIQYDHEKIYPSECQDIVDKDSGYVARQYKVRINVDGVYHYVVSQCTPDVGDSRISLRSTTDGCDDPADFSHEIGAGRSYGLERFYYISPGASEPTRVSGCVRSNRFYRHDLETVGYNHNDAQLVSLPRSRVSISTDSGVYVIEEDIEIPGSAAISYTYVRSEDELVVPQDRSYEGCNAFDRGTQVIYHTRPDGTSYKEITGNSILIAQGDVCMEEKVLGSTYTTGGCQGATSGGARTYRWRRYVINNVREDGVIISSSSGADLEYRSRQNACTPPRNGGGRGGNSGDH